MQSKAATVQDYLEELPAERRRVVAAVREVILKHLPKGYAECMNWGMISYEIPLADYPDTYNQQPLAYAALAAQKHHFALYLMAVYQDPVKGAILKNGFAKAGKKLNMGKSCIRFRKLEEIPLEVIGELIASTPPQALIAGYEQVRKKS